MKKHYIVPETIVVDVDAEMSVLQEMSIPIKTGEEDSDKAKPGYVFDAEWHDGDEE